MLVVIAIIAILSGGMLLPAISPRAKATVPDDGHVLNTNRQISDRVGSCYDARSFRTAVVKQLRRHRDSQLEGRDTAG
jgi:hypothetical protein